MIHSDRLSLKVGGALRGLSQDKLAEEASLDRTYLSGIERGVRNPGIKVVIRLARGLSVSIDSAKTIAVSGGHLLLHQPAS